MIQIKKANAANAETLALLGTLTYIESHGHFIADKNALNNYIKASFSISNIKAELTRENNLFYIIYTDEMPIGYAKLMLNETHENTTCATACKLDKIYILQQYIPLKVGQQFLQFLEQMAANEQQNSMWLSVYTENKRAIRFYQKNGYKEVGQTTFLVSGVGYENIVFEKALPLT